MLCFYFLINTLSENTLVSLFIPLLLFSLAIVTFPILRILHKNLVENIFAVPCQFFIFQCIKYARIQEKSEQTTLSLSSDNRFIILLFSAVLCTFAMKVYTTDLAHRSYSFQYSFILAFVGVGLFVINFFSIIFTFQILKR